MMRPALHSFNARSHSADPAGTHARSGAGPACLVLGARASGPTALDLAEADLEIVGQWSGDAAGYDLSGAGDVDGDGCDDLWVGAWYEATGAPARAYLIYGGGAHRALDRPREM